MKPVIITWLKLDNTTIKDQLVKPVVKKGLCKKKKGEIINMLIANETPKTMVIKKGKILGFAENISRMEEESICIITEML